jgi:hypothetical protein
MVSIAITVHNAGHGIAGQVHLHETPPAGGVIVAVADHGSLQRNGTAVWNIGALAPGSARTVHVTMRVTRTGLLVNTAVAADFNADPVVAQAAVRVTRHHITKPPKFTG